jgi:hypothetical protein
MASSSSREKGRSRVDFVLAENVEAEEVHHDDG